MAPDKQGSQGKEPLRLLIDKPGLVLEADGRWSEILGGDAERIGLSWQPLLAIEENGLPRGAHSWLRLDSDRGEGKRDTEGHARKEEQDEEGNQYPMPAGSDGVMWGPELRRLRRKSTPLEWSGRWGVSPGR